MALKKSDLRSILKNEDSSNEEKISEILNILHDEVDAVKDERDELKNQVSDLQEKVKNASNVDDTELNEWKEKYNKEHEAFETYKSEQKAAEELATKQTAYKDVLKKAGISEKAIELILDGSKAKDSINAIEFDEAGKVKGIDELTKAIKEDYSGFITSVKTSGATTVTPPASTGTNGKKTKEEIMAIKDATERQKAIAENPEAFGL